MRVNAPLRLKLRHMPGALVGMAALVGVATGAPALAQDAGERSAEEVYAALLKQIDDTRTNIARQELLIAGQQESIESLQGQIARVPQLEAEYTPVLTRFASRIEAAVENDVPFKIGERFGRLGAMQELMGKEDARLGEKLARALLIAEVETTYGYELEAYDANHPTDPGRRFRACQENVESDACAFTDDLRESMAAGQSIPQMELDLTDGSYVRYGRLALAYVDLGTDEMLTYDAATGEWIPVSGSDEANLRRNLRIARGEAAPDVVQAPVVKTN